MSYIQIRRPSSGSSITIEIPYAIFYGDQLIKELRTSDGAVIWGQNGEGTNDGAGGASGSRSGGISLEFTNPENWVNDFVPNLSSGESIVNLERNVASNVGLPSSIRTKTINASIFIKKLTFKNVAAPPAFSRCNPASSVAEIGIVVPTRSTIKIGDGGIIGYQGFVDFFGGSITLASNQTWDLRDNSYLDVIMIDGNFNLIKTGTGTLEISGSSSTQPMRDRSSSASYTLQEGILKIISSSALNLSPEAPFFLNGGEFVLMGSSVNPRSYNGTNIFVGGNAKIATCSSTNTKPVTVYRVTIGSNTLEVVSPVLETQSIVLNGDSVFNVTNSSGSGINGLFKNLGTTTESGGSRSITKTGPGTLILAGDNSYTGSTSILVGTLRVEKLFSGPVEKFLFAEFTTGNLLVKFSSNPVVGESYKLLPGSTQQNFDTVTLLDNADNIIPELVGSYNSSNSTLSIS